jgi:hypothetical protein
MQKNGKITFHIETVFFSGCFADLNCFSYITYCPGLKKYNLQIGIFVSLGFDTAQSGRNFSYNKTESSNFSNVFLE